MYTVVITSAGTGSRLGLGYNKMVHLVDGKPIFLHTIEKFSNIKSISEIILVTSELDKDYVEKMIKSNNLDVKIVIGGETRGHSVRNGISEATNKYTLVHDGARMNISETIINNCIEKISDSDCVLTALKATDTVRFKNNTYDLVDRENVFLAQTPQGAHTKILLECYDKALKNKDNITDDISVLQLYSDLSVKIVEGSKYNFKITTKEDLDYINYLRSRK